MELLQSCTKLSPWSNLDYRMPIPANMVIILTNDPDCFLSCIHLMMPLLVDQRQAVLNDPLDIMNIWNRNTPKKNAEYRTQNTMATKNKGWVYLCIASTKPLWKCLGYICGIWKCWHLKVLFHLWTCRIFTGYMENLNMPTCMVPWRKWPGACKSVCKSHLKCICQACWWNQ